MRGTETDFEKCELTCGTEATFVGALWRQAFLRCNAYDASWLRRPISVVASVALRSGLPTASASPSLALAIRHTFRTVFGQDAQRLMRRP
jgi:hypothetical protein